MASELSGGNLSAVSSAIALNAIQSQLERLNKIGSAAKGLGFAELALAITLLAVGVILCVFTGPVGIGFGATMIALSLPIFFLGYNDTMMAINMAGREAHDSIANAENAAFKRSIAKNTVFYSLIVNARAEKILGHS